ncbi:YmfQ family protein [Wohlfahrtiimonas larvae]|nr:putative phage tail protein [Wohlfahrtiimonas larvae]
MMDYRIALPKLLPPVSYDRNGAELKISLLAEANALNTVQAHATKVLNAVTPFYAGELLEDWERVLGLIIDKADLYQARLERVLEKLAEVGGLSIPYFIGLAAKTGYEISISEGADEIFRAGVNRVGDRLGSDDLLWVWRVHVKSKFEKIYYFRAGMSHANDRLRVYADPALEAILNDLKPAFTYITFFYSDLNEES